MSRAVRSAGAIVAALLILASAAIFFFRATRSTAPRAGFVAVRGTEFVLDGQPFRFVGANVAVIYGRGERERMSETLRTAAESGARVVRVWAFGEGDGSGIRSSADDAPLMFRRAPDQWNEEAFVHLDRVIAEAGRLGLRVQLCLTNWWRDTGGVTEYLRWAGIDAVDERAPYGIDTERAMAFYSDPTARRLYREHVARIVLRRNTITGVLYRDDPTIFGYELINEAQAPTGRWAERRAWVAEMSAYIKSLDPFHLVTPGTWGYRTSWERREWIAEHRLPTIDFCDVHHYPRDDADSFVSAPEDLPPFLANRMAAALAVGKPLVMGEFGVPRDGLNGHTRRDWLRAYFGAAARLGAAGAMLWIVTPDAGRDYGITPDDLEVHDEMKRGAQLMAQRPNPPAELFDGARHLAPVQFAFARRADDEAALPHAPDDRANLYRFRPEQAVRGQFEKLGSGAGYVWGAGAGFFEYVVPPRHRWQRISEVRVRARLQPVVPSDARGRISGSQVELRIDGTRCGAALVPEDERDAIYEWRVRSWPVIVRASLGRPLAIRFVVEPTADLPYGLNIANPRRGSGAQWPIEVELRE